jgi:hypothetical protein
MSLLSASTNLGAESLGGWTIYRLARDAIERLAFADLSGAGNASAPINSFGSDQIGWSLKIDPIGPEVIGHGAAISGHSRVQRLRA